jgi:hypothetical protein
MSPPFLEWLPNVGLGAEQQVEPSLLFKLLSADYHHYTFSD